MAPIERNFTQQVPYNGVATAGLLDDRTTSLYNSTKSNKEIGPQTAHILFDNSDVLLYPNNKSPGIVTTYHAKGLPR